MFNNGIFAETIWENKGISNIKLAVIYYSVSGTNYELAKWFEEVAKKQVLR